MRLAMAILRMYVGIDKREARNIPRKKNKGVVREKNGLLLNAKIRIPKRKKRNIAFFACSDLEE